jgi:voltage-gated sodium channel
MYGSDKYGYGDYPDVLTSPLTYPIVSPLFFISFVLLGTMIILNLFVGVIINGMAEIQTEAEIKRLEEHRRRGYLTISDEVRLLHYQIEELGKSLKVIQVRLKANDGEIAKDLLKHLKIDQPENQADKRSRSRSERITLLKGNDR